MKYILSALFFSVSATTSPFVISEIFSNGVGRSDHGKEWIELINTSETPISVSHVRVDITHNQAKSVTMERDFFLPLTFSFALLIAQNQTLGFASCNFSSTIVAMDHFSLPNTGELKICVTLNHSLRTCTILPKKQKRPDGIGLFRELSDKGESPLFLHEPCHLIGKIFATPGTKARACMTDPNFAASIFTRCEEREAKDGVLSKFNVSPHQNLTVPFALSLQDGGYQVALTAPNNDMPYLASLCSAPVHSNAICHIIDQKAVTTSPTNFNWSFARYPDDKFYFVLRDFYGAEKSIDIPQMPIPHRKETAPFSLKATRQESSAAIDIAIMPEELPITIWVLTKDKQILHQTASATIPNKHLDLSFDPSHPPSHIRFVGIKSMGILPIKFSQ